MIISFHSVFVPSKSDMFRIYYNQLKSQRPQVPEIKLNFQNSNLLNYSQPRYYCFRVFQGRRLVPEPIFQLIKCKSDVLFYNEVCNSVKGSPRKGCSKTLCVYACIKRDQYTGALPLNMPTCLCIFFKICTHIGVIFIKTYI